MDTIKINKKNTLLIAHRGVSDIEQENTYASFLLAAFKSYYGIETDVHVTKDNKFILCHDDNIKRVTGVDKIIEESTYDELRKIPIYDKNGKYSKYSYLPNLEEYINICKSFNKYAVLELKGSMTETNLQDIYNIIKNLNYLSKMIFISFNKNNIKILKNIYPEGKYQFLNDIDTEEKKKETIDFAKELNIDVDVNSYYITQEFINKCQKENIKINVYTVNEIDDAKKLIEMGVNYITSNILE